ncbi:hypothetical protein SDC9_198564 [bioreactor metagenome]|uniref:Uncharacterized protein n=1 Tax=bioreactor metagenome TaxID=1076179 RepID=A0A645IRB7_9ZZZZ
MPDFTMVELLVRVLDDPKPQRPGSGGHLVIRHPRAVQIGRVAGQMPGIWDAAHLGVASFTAHAGGDDDGLVKITPKRFDFLKQLRVHGRGPAVTVARAVAGVFVHEEVFRRPGAIGEDGVLGQGVVDDGPVG